MRRESWNISWRQLTFKISPTGFKHTGLFPEQAVNWDYAMGKLAGRPGANILNLFAYTGGATPVSYTHLDVYKRQIKSRLLPRPRRTPTSPSP